MPFSRVITAQVCVARGQEGGLPPLSCHSTQSAMKTLVSPRDFALRFDANTSFLPSGENMGKPSNVSLNVMRSRPLPSTLIL